MLYELVHKAATYGKSLSLAGNNIVSDFTESDLMKTRQEVIDYCLSLEFTFEDYPFSDHNWTIMRHKDNKKMFAAVYERFGIIWINVKCNPQLALDLRDIYEAVVPAYHMNKYHWNSIILNGTILDDEIKDMINHSYNLTKQKRKVQ